VNNNGGNIVGDAWDQKCLVPDIIRTRGWEVPNSYRTSKERVCNAVLVCKNTKKNRRSAAWRCKIWSRRARHETKSTSRKERIFHSRGGDWGKREKKKSCAVIPIGGGEGGGERKESSEQRRAPRITMGQNLALSRVNTQKPNEVSEKSNQ